MTSLCKHGRDVTGDPNRCESCRSTKSPDVPRTSPMSLLEAFQLAMPPGYELRDRETLVGCSWGHGGVWWACDKYWNAVRAAWEQYSVSPPGCLIDSLSSKACALGTKSCVVNHDPDVTPTGVLDPEDEGCVACGGWCPCDSQLCERCRHVGSAVAPLDAPREPTWGSVARYINEELHSDPDEMLREAAATLEQHDAKPNPPPSEVPDYGPCCYCGEQMTAFECDAKTAYSLADSEGFSDDEKRLLCWECLVRGEPQREIGREEGRREERARRDAAVERVLTALSKRSDEFGEFGIGLIAGLMAGFAEGPDHDQDTE